MRNTTPRRALSRRATQERTLAFVLGATGLFLVVLGVALFVIPLVGQNNPGFALYSLLRTGLIGVGAVALFLAVALMVRAFTYRADNTLAQQVARALGAALDDSYTYVRSVNRRGVGYIDAVLIGPAGVLVLRILDQAGIFYNDGPNWLESDPARGPQAWKPAGIKPTAECFADMRQLDKYLTARGLGGMPIFGAIVFTRDAPQVQLTVRNPSLPATTVAGLVPSLRTYYLTQSRIDASRAQQAVNLLFE